MEFSVSETALAALQEFLEDAAVAGAAINELHVVFRRGTVVRVCAADIALYRNANPFNAEYISRWPLEILRDPEDFITILEDLAEKYNVTYDFAGDVSTAAYSMLLSAGYLEPGPQADRAATFIGDDTYYVCYPNSGNASDQFSKKIFSVVESGSAGAADAADAAVTLAGDYRRLDWMFPEIKTIIRKLGDNIPDDGSAK